MRYDNATGRVNHRTLHTRSPNTLPPLAAVSGSASSMLAASRPDVALSNAPPQYRSDIPNLQLYAPISPPPVAMRPVLRAVLEFRVCVADRKRLAALPPRLCRAQPHAGARTFQRRCLRVGFPRHVSMRLGALVRSLRRVSELVSLRASRRGALVSKQYEERIAVGN